MRRSSPQDDDCLSEAKLRDVLEAIATLQVTAGLALDKGDAWAAGQAIAEISAETQPVADAVERRGNMPPE